MKDLSDTKRDYQAEVHFALGAVIQGVTVAALGNELAAALKNLPFPGAIWIFATGLQSLLLCIAFWYTFMNNYFFGFRAINLTAKTHLLFAALYLVLGLQQLIAIQLLDTPRLWMSFYVLLIATVLANSWASAHVPVVQRKGARQALEYDPGSKLFLSTFLLSVICLILWYVVPGIDTDLFRAVALSTSGVGLVLFTIYYVQVFQKHLDMA
jgi:cytochrome bd-type quinol oxidase subunit 2